jgi:uncharacterized membrane protein YdjX (TVP38/TMEM64 family)
VKKLALAGLVALCTWLLYSYRAGGIVFTLVDVTHHSDRSLDTLREYLARWGPLGPAAYVVLVVIEVLAAPIPGTLLYAPGGALFGGLLGGTLSLAGNVIGATIACAVARVWSGRFTQTLNSRGLAQYRDRLVTRGGWMIFLLRVNPMTSSDLVSYAAGVIGVSPWQVALGTLAGMAPLCYAQAYLADRIVRVMPGSLWVIVVLALAYAGLVIWILTRHARSMLAPGNAPTDGPPRQ